MLPSLRKKYYASAVGKLRLMSFKKCQCSCNQESGIFHNSRNRVHLSLRWTISYLTKGNHQNQTRYCDAIRMCQILRRRLRLYVQETCHILQCHKHHSVEGRRNCRPALNRQNILHSPLPLQYNVNDLSRQQLKYRKTLPTKLSKRVVRLPHPGERQPICSVRYHLHYLLISLLDHVKNTKE